MPMTAKNAELQLEFSAVAQGITLLTDSGDRKKFTSSIAPWSRQAAHTPKVYPNGIETGGAVIPAVSGTNDLVDVAALTCRLAGVKTSVAADTDVAVTRAAGGGNDFKISSITVDSAGAVAVVAGTDGTGFVEGRGAAGGPPYIPVGSIEIAQVRLATTTAAAIAAAEIFSSVGVHRELSASPGWAEDFAVGEVNFRSVLPAIHTGDTAKRIYAEFSEVAFEEVSIASAFVAPEKTSTVNTTQHYKEIVGAVAESFTQGSFTVIYRSNGIRDSIVQMVGERVWAKFYPDPVAWPDDYVLGNGFLNKTNAYPAADNISGAYTLSSDSAAISVSG